MLKQILKSNHIQLRRNCTAGNGTDVPASCWKPGRDKKGFPVDLKGSMALLDTLDLGLGASRAVR